jgi:glyoxylase-like metal-dependent hydrolase (beta-lactamase superfamily II)/ferredoxin
MALRSLRHPEGVDGDWFIDERCIGCGAATSIAPHLIRPASDGRQFVFIRQPESRDEVVLAQQAAEVCPSHSIGTESARRWSPHHPMEVAPGIWRTGSNSEATAGGNAFLVQRPGDGLLVDVPRFTPRLRDELERLGGFRTILLTHRDDVGDAERYADVFGAEVVIHEADHDAAPFATRRLTGTSPIAVAPGVTALPTPGHTEGHTMYLLDDGTLFTGDSLAWEPDRGDLWAEQLVCWWSWPAQLESLSQLAQHRFTRVIPTHGAISPELEPVEMRDRLLRLVEALTEQPAL